jgi:predicted nucleic acid-binding protein
VKEINYPNNLLSFNKDIKVLLDANIFLHDLYSSDKVGIICSKLLKELSDSSTQIYISNVIISEVLNKIIKAEFESDMYYKLDKIVPINSTKIIDKIVSVLNSSHGFNIKLEDKDIMDKINLAQCFNILNKNKMNRYLLKPYFDITINIYNNFKKKLGLEYLMVSEDIYNKSLNNFQIQMMNINDAQHLQVALDNKMDYIITTDKDFSFVAEVYETKILKIDKNSEDIDYVAIN